MLKSYARGFLTACALASSLPCHAQYERLRFDHLTVEDGLSSNWVQSILKDYRGFLWFGTQDGLNRYDGGAIKIYRHDPLDPHSLPSSIVGALYEDGKRRLWIGSGWGRQGLALYDREHDHFKRYYPNPGRTIGNEVRAIIEDRQGRIWLGTDNGIVRFNPDTGDMRRFPLVADGDVTPNERILSLIEDRHNRIWAGSDEGLLRFDRESGEYERWPDSSDHYPALRRAQIEDLYEDEKGALWVATLDDGLYLVDLSTGRETRFLPDTRDPASISHSRVRRLVPVGKTTLYVGTENGGLNILDLRTHKFIRVGSDPESETSMNSASIWSMYRDEQGILWIGTYNGGVNYASPWGRQFEHIKFRPGGLSDPHVNAVIEDRAGNLWIGTNDGGLNRLDRRTGMFTHFRHDPKNNTTIGSNAMWALIEDKQGCLWVGGWDSGLGRLDPASGRFERFRHDPTDPRSIVSDHVWRILELRTGELLVATHEGADLFDRKAGRFTRLAERYPGAGLGAVFSAAEDGKGDLWLVGNLFVGHVERATGRITRYRNNPLDPQSLGGGWTQAVLIDSVGNVWLGTEGGLTCVIAGGGATRRYTTSDGLPNDTITSIQDDDSGNLWVATNRGLSKLVNAVQVPEKPTFVNFDIHDGLQGNEFTRNASCRGRDGEMFFGGSRGLNMFYPELIRRNPHSPPIVLTDLKIFNAPAGIGASGSPLEKAITECSRLTLSYRHSMVTFEFAALNFVLPQKNQHAYMLEGFDRDWNIVGTQRFATYTNLPYGEFTLRVRGSNNDGVWNDEGVSLKIRVTPPFWRTSWFVALVGLSLLSAGFGLYRQRIRAHIERRKELETRVAEAVADIKTLRGLLPMCAWCRKVRDDGGYWSRLEEYVSDHTNAEFSHGICPECRVKSFGHRTEE